MRLLRLNNITVMLLMPTIAFGITSAGMQFRKVKPIPSRLKGITLSCATTWLVWPGRLVVSRVVPMHSSVLCACLSFVSTAASFISIVSLLILPMLSSSLALEFIHSLKLHNSCRSEKLCFSLIFPSDRIRDFQFHAPDARVEDDDQGNENV